MQHIYEFIIKHPAEEGSLHNIYNTDSGRLSKVAKKLIEDLNVIRKTEGLFPYKREDLEEFRIRQMR